MEGTCPQCQARLEIPGPGVYECERCHARFEVASSAAEPVPPPPGASPESPAESGLANAAPGPPAQPPGAPAGPPPPAPGFPPVSPGAPAAPVYGQPSAPWWAHQPPSGDAPFTPPPGQTATPAGYPPGTYGGTPAYGYAAPAPAPPQPVLDPALQAPCATHPGNAAERVCERCGDFMCRLCTTPVEGRLYCPKCFDLLYNRGSLQFAQRQFTLPGVSLGLGIGALVVSFVCCLANIPVSMLLAAGGIVTGMKALKEHRERPELPNRGLTISGISLSAAALVIDVAEIGFWVWTFTKS